jgi:hypothetical protein
VTTKFTATPATGLPKAVDDADARADLQRAARAHRLVVAARHDAARGGAGVPVMTNVAAPVTPCAVAVIVFAPTVLPSVKPPMVATPCALVVAVSRCPCRRRQ